ncbi:sugar phosphate isomerase/epimerase [Vallitalea pronyensis]|uniref:Sugar phosphate isomerase/epimerase n=1 Tax=Vallitalea pronyensis TaxID=1348613 RepID=A0A8J8SGJ3_9FIRM|nr:sugar phosphate isomerase/epimerase [Vallitalea pronyensis]QUI22661.1 sugar phosphate isomerase/epimerase [Vallitalea pronyensis]
MKRLMIGQYGHFDKNKQGRDYRDYFFGVEVCMMEKEEDIVALVREAQHQQFQIGVHFPLRKARELRDPLVLAINQDVKDKAYACIEDEIAYIHEKMKPSYILFHYPKPVIISKAVDWRHWRFGDEREFVEEAAYDYETFLSDSERFLEYLTQQATIYGFTPILELDGLNAYMVHREGFIKLLDKYSVVKICLDISRLHLQACMDQAFNPFETVVKYAPYTELVHLSNGRLEDNHTNNHYPALPELSSDKGWADIEHYLSTMNHYNKQYKLLFEHRSDRITDEQLEACYTWVNRLINT